jgi:uncharacterized protein (TIGR00369 family)
MATRDRSGAIAAQQLFVLHVSAMGDPVFRSKGCFVCGTDNPGGLNLPLTREDGKVWLAFTPSRPHLGFSRAVHGGIVASLLDEVCGVACGLESDGKCATVELTITYRRPLLEGVAVRAEGWCDGRDGRFCLGAGRIVDGAGHVLASATGKFLPLTDEQIAKFVGDGQQATGDGR